MRQELIREIDHAILIDRLLSDERYARDVLLVCDALGAGDLPALATLFRDATAAELPAGQGAAPPRQAPGHARQANDWGRDTSGFGVSQPPGMAPELPEPPGRPAPDGAPTERRRSWTKPWRRD
jgi:hypothetical protein